MAYNEQLSDRVRALLASETIVAEKYMFGGVCYMVNDKMCVGVVGDELMCRLAPEEAEQLLDGPGCRQMDYTGKPMKGYVFVEAGHIATSTALKKWVDRCLEFNPIAKSASKKKK